MNGKNTPITMKLDTKMRTLTLFVGAVRETFHFSSTPAQADALLKRFRFAYSQGVMDSASRLKKQSFAVLEPLVLEK